MTSHPINPSSGSQFNSLDLAMYATASSFVIKPGGSLGVENKKNRLTRWWRAITNHQDSSIKRTMAALDRFLTSAQSATLSNTGRWSDIDNLLQLKERITTLQGKVKDVNAVKSRANSSFIKFFNSEHADRYDDADAFASILTKIEGLTKIIVPSPAGATTESIAVATPEKTQEDFLVEKNAQIQASITASFDSDLDACVEHFKNIIAIENEVETSLKDVYYLSEEDLTAALKPFETWTELARDTVYNRLTDLATEIEGQPGVWERPTTRRGLSENEIKLSVFIRNAIVLRPYCSEDQHDLLAVKLNAFSERSPLSKQVTTAASSPLAAALQTQAGAAPTSRHSRTRPSGRGGRLARRPHSSTVAPIASASARLSPETLATLMEPLNLCIMVGEEQKDAAVTQLRQILKDGHLQQVMEHYTTEYVLTDHTGNTLAQRTDQIRFDAEKISELNRLKGWAFMAIREEDTVVDRAPNIVDRAYGRYPYTRAFNEHIRVQEGKKSAKEMAFVTALTSTPYIEDDAADIAASAALLENALLYGEAQVLSEIEKMSHCGEIDNGTQTALLNALLHSPAQFNVVLEASDISAEKKVALTIMMGNMPAGTKGIRELLAELQSSGKLDAVLQHIGSQIDLNVPDWTTEPSTAAEISARLKEVVKTKSQADKTSTMFTLLQKWTGSVLFADGITRVNLRTETMVQLINTTVQTRGDAIGANALKHFCEHYKTVDVGGGGNCQAHSASYSLFSRGIIDASSADVPAGVRNVGNNQYQHYHLALREKIYQELHNASGAKRMRYKQVFKDSGEGGTYEDFLTKTRRETEWLSLTHLEAVSEMYQVPIVILGFTSGGKSNTKILGMTGTQYAEGDDAKTPLTIYNLNPTHFQAVVANHEPLQGGGLSSSAFRSDGRSVIHGSGAKAGTRATMSFMDRLRARKRA